nr:response regulator transcription factor [Nitrospirota bacterium]
MLAEDHTLVRAGLCALLRNVPGVEIVAETGDGQEALRLIREHRPDVALLDISMPGLNGLEVLVRVKEECPAVRVIILSVHATDEYVWRALQDGAVGYVLKDAGAADLEQAIKTASRDKPYLSSAVSRRGLEEYSKGRSGNPGPHEILTSRQREILQLLAEGHTTKDIAHMLQLSAKTVETHRAQLMERLGIHDVPGLVRYAIRVGLVSPEK